MKILPCSFMRHLVIGSLLIVSSCTLNSSRSFSPTMQKRVNESRIFEAPNQEYLLQTVITTLQDQGYNILKVNTNNFEVTAQRDGDILLTVIIYEQTSHHFTVRANAQKFTGETTFSLNSTGYQIVTDPVFYQQEFFNPLSKSLYLKKENLPN